MDDDDKDLLTKLLKKTKEKFLSVDSLGAMYIEEEEERDEMKLEEKETLKNYVGMCAVVRSSSSLHTPISP